MGALHPPGPRVHSRKMKVDFAPVLSSIDDAAETTCQTIAEGLSLGLHREPPYDISPESVDSKTPSYSKEDFLEPLGRVQREHPGNAAGRANDQRHPKACLNLKEKSQDQSVKTGLAGLKDMLLGQQNDDIFLCRLCRKA